MPFNPRIHHRRSIRLPGYDYSQAGAYFITLCTHQREHLFGEIKDGEMHLNNLGEIVREAWLETPIIRPYVELSEWVIMPNHFHAIVIIKPSDPSRTGGLPSDSSHPGGLPSAPTSPSDSSHPGASPSDPSRTGASPSDPSRTGGLPSAPTSPSHTIGAIIRGFKSAATKRINEHRNTPGAPVWQRNYYERIIRDKNAHRRIAEYILNNPFQWKVDILFGDPQS